MRLFDHFVYHIWYCVSIIFFLCNYNLIAEMLCSSELLKNPILNLKRNDTDFWF